MTDRPDPRESTLYLCIGMNVKSTLYLCTRLVVNDWQSWPGKPTLYLCIGMIVKSTFVFVHFLRLFVTGSHGPGKSTLYLCIGLIVNEWQS